MKESHWIRLGTDAESIRGKDQRQRRKRLCLCIGPGTRLFILSLCITNIQGRKTSRCLRGSGTPYASCLLENLPYFFSSPSPLSLLPSALYTLLPLFLNPLSAFSSFSHSFLFFFPLHNSSTPFLLILYSSFTVFRLFTSPLFLWGRRNSV